MKYLMLFMLMAALNVPGYAYSGNEGSIDGVVTDPTEAVLPGVLVSARNVHTSATFSTVTDSRGSFRFLVLSAGEYDLALERPGFAKFIQKGVVVTVGARVSLTFSVRVASQTELVEVSGQAPVVEAARTQFSSTVDQRLIASLPVNGRNFLDFILLTPGVNRSPLRAGLSFGGQRGLNSLLVDGIDNNNTFFGTQLGISPAPYHLSQEAVQEFQVSSNAYSAEQGRAGAGLVNVVTKSGTNEFHGSLFWHYRDRGLNATDVISKTIGQPKQAFHVHQFGGTAGGPLLRNRLFFFANYDAQRRLEQNPTFLNLPPGFRMSPDPAIAAFQQQALDYLRPRATPWIRGFDQDIWLAKLDWRLNSGHLLTARWNRQRFAGLNLDSASVAVVLGGTGSQVSLERTGDLAQNSDTIAMSLTSVLSPSTVNVARFSYLRSNEPARPNGSNPDANIFEAGQLVLSIGRFGASPREHSIRRGEWSDTLSLGRGKHVIKVGSNLLVDRIRLFNAPNFSGSYRFSSLESFGRSLAGVASTASGETFVQSFSGEGTPGISVHPNIVELGAFAEAEWRVRPNLTFILGLRYDVQAMASPKVKNPALEWSSAGIDTSFISSDLNNFAPRFGFAWDPLASRLVVRGGYGLFYARTTAGVAARTHFQNGITVQTRTFTGSSIPSYPNTLCGPPDPSGAPPSCPAPAAGSDIILPFSQYHAQPLIQQGSLGVEREVTRNTSLSISYLAVKGMHLHRYRDVNLGPSTSAIIGIAGTNQLLDFQRFTIPRPLPNFDRILLFESNAQSIYHAMALQLNKRFSHNFQLLGSYTLSKVIDDNPDPAPLNPGEGDSRLLSDSSNPRADRGPGLNDQRHRFVLSGVWELDYAKRMPSLARTLLADWELSGILTAQSGQPYSGRVNFDLNNDGNAANDRTPGLGRNSFYLPATVSLDPRLTRTFRFTEDVGLQLMWEAFNVLNSGNITGVRMTQFSRSTSTSVCGIAGSPCLVPQDAGLTAFGMPTGTSGPRIMQLSLKLLF